MINTSKNGNGDCMADYIINISGNICELFVLHFFFTGSFVAKFKKSTTIALSIFFVFIQFLSTNLFLSKSSLIILGAVLFCFLVSLLYKMKWSKRILYTIFLFLILAFPEAIIGMTLSLLFDVDVSYLQNTPLMFATCTLASKFLSYIFILITKNRNFRLDSDSPKRNIFGIYSLPVASVFIMVLFLRCCYIIEEFSFQIITLISSIVLAFANIAVFHIIDILNELIETKEKLLFAEKHINNQMVHYQELYKYQNELRIFRHDIRNRLLSLIGLIKENETEKALQTMKSNLDWLDQKTNNIVNSGNPVIDAILQSKLHFAKEKGIFIDVFIRLSTSIKIDEIELGIILGNALDNAIEAVTNISHNENRNIEIRMITVADRISISIKNFVEANIDTKNLITTKSNREFHGYGIKSIQALAKKHDGIVLFSCENKVFTVNINLSNHPV